MNKSLSVVFGLMIGTMPGLHAQIDLGDLAEKAKSVAAGYDLPPAIVDQAKELATAFGLSKANLSKYAKDALTALNGGKDLEALNLLSKIGGASLSTGQKSTYQDLKILVDTYVLKKQLDKNEQASGPLGQALGAITSGDYASVAAQLGTLVNTVKPTGEQLSILSALKTQYSDWAKSEAE